MNLKNYKKSEIVLIIITGIVLGMSFFAGIMEGGDALFIFWASLFALIFGVACKKIGDDKGINNGFFIGWFLGIIGLIIISVMKGNTEKIDNNKVNIDKYESLAKLQKLKEAGAITEVEFEIEKQKLLK